MYNCTRHVGPICILAIFVWRYIFRYNAVRYRCGQSVQCCLVMFDNIYCSVYTSYLPLGRSYLLFLHLVEKQKHIVQKFSHFKAVVGK